MEGLTEGRIVHFVVEEGKHRPAVIVNVWNVTNQCDGYANLLVFMDGTNDRMRVGEYIAWQTSVCYDENKAPRTWHWIEKA